MTSSHLAVPRSPLRPSNLASQNLNVSHLTPQGSKINMSPRPSISKPKYYRIGENGERIEIDGPLTPGRPLSTNISTNASPTPRIFGESSIGGAGQGSIMRTHTGNYSYQQPTVNAQGITIPIQQVQAPLIS